MQVGTGGGAVGAMASPKLVSFGANDLRGQVAAGNTDIYAAQRAGTMSPVVNSPSGQSNTSAPMSSNLDSSYLHLNIAGSPLPRFGLLTAQNTRAAQATQNNITAMDQYMYMRGMNAKMPLPLNPNQVVPVIGATSPGQQAAANVNRTR
jgi:hypothetical protein